MKRQMVVSREEEARHSHDEWLGPESHIPSLSGALRHRDRRTWQSVFPWLAGGLFLTGMLLGSTATWLLSRHRKSV